MPTVRFEKRHMYIWYIFKEEIPIILEGSG